MSATHHSTGRLRVYAAALATVVLLNAGFLIINILVARSPKEPFRQRIEQAFRTQHLIERDWTEFDWRRGYNQYDDCMIFQMLMSDPGTAVQGAVGPRLYTYADSTRTFTGLCRTLRELVVDDSATSGYLEIRYGRYWHGYVPVAAAALSFATVERARVVLQISVYAALLWLMAASLAARSLLRVVGVAAAVVLATLWALPYFAQLFAHAPGDLLLVLAIAALIQWRERLLAPSRLVPWCAAFGALAVYLEFLTGQLPTAGSLLFVVAYAAERSAGRPAQQCWRSAISGLAAFVTGAMATVAIKQMLVLTILGPDPVGAFANNLALYTSWPEPGGILPGILRPFSQLVRSSEMLTYGNHPAAYALLAATAAAWTFGIVTVIRTRPSLARAAIRHDIVAMVVGTGVVVGWVLILPNHTFIHATFMVRMGVIPIALGVVAAVWAATGRATSSSSNPASP